MSSFDTPPTFHIHHHDHPIDIPISLYIHIPWCVKKCPYCDFNSHAIAGNLPESEYIEALKQDLQQELPKVQGRMIETIFFGGGTPSLFSPKSIEAILCMVQKTSCLNPDAEITLEANPGTLEHRHFKDYALAGINRVSLGVQSFEESKLKSLGRIHSHREAFNAIESIHKAFNTGLRSFNIDLMYGLPDQSLNDALSDIRTALSFSPPHLSWYNLTIEPNTIFYSKPPILPDDDLIWEIEQEGRTLLEASGFDHYETSAFAKAGHHCRHNLNYWEFGDYIGIGAGAHGKISGTRHENEYPISPVPNTESADKTPFSIIRYSKKRMPQSYLQAGKVSTSNFITHKSITAADRNNANHFTAELRAVSTQELPFEFMMNALRLRKGFTQELFQARTGLSFACITSSLEQAKERELLIEDLDSHIIPTSLGRRFLNELLQIFMP